MLQNIRSVPVLFFPLCLAILVSACGPNPYQHGERLYETHCANCHMENGEGLGALIPPLDAGYLAANQDKLPCLIRYGLKDTITIQGKTYAELMPGLPALNEVQITNLLNYLRVTWGNEEMKRPFRLDEVSKALENCPGGQ